MKSTIGLVLAGLASTVVAQPHHAHAHQHPGRVNHHHGHDKRFLKTEYEVVWVTETVTEVIDATTTEYFTAEPTVPPTTLATVTTSSSASAGQFFEGATSSSSSVVKATPTPSSSSSTSTYVAPAPPTTATSETPVVEPTTSTPEVVETPTTTEEEVAAAPTTAEVAVASAASSANTDSTSSTLSGTSFSGKITWIGDTSGAYSACGAPYESGSMYVAVNPGVLDCGSGKGTTMSITANGKTVSAYAIDKCMGCDSTHIDVSTAVYEALGYTTDDGGMHNTGAISWIISQISA